MIYLLKNTSKFKLYCSKLLNEHRNICIKHYNWKCSTYLYEFNIYYTVYTLYNIQKVCKHLKIFLS